MAQLELETSGDTFLDDAVEFGPVCAPELAGINVGSRLIVRLGKHAYNREKDLLYRLDRGPSFGAVFILIWIVSRRMQDADAYSTIFVN